MTAGETPISEKIVINKIYELRSYRVMLDSDLAELYAIETKRLNEQVRRNRERFPPDFMFRINEDEWTVLRSQIATLKRGKHSKYRPFAFTEYGVLMLSSVLNSGKAIQVNIQLVRIFSRLRHLINDHHSLRIDISEIKTKLNNHDKSIELVFTYLDELTEAKANPEPRKRIGYMPDEI
ncbi:MAG: ORF6N domain-containing protein [Daejeonella sp.]